MNIGSEENDLPNFENSTDGDKKPVIKRPIEDLDHLNESTHFVSRLLTLYSTLQSIFNAKISQLEFWHSTENGLQLDFNATSV